MRPGASHRSSTSRRLIVLFAAVATALGSLATAVTPVRAAPVLGGQIFSTGTPIEIEVLPATAALTSELWLLEPQQIFIATNRQLGAIIDVGPFPVGVELLFGIRVAGNEFRMGPGDRNPDGIPHAVVNFIDATTAIVGFEDLFGGGDRDYDDNVFRFVGGIAPEPPPDPDPDPDPDPGTPPIANAGPDQSVPEGSVVQLDATGSTDPGGGGLVPSEASANLPGGTAIEAALDQLSPAAGGNQTLTGTAAIGEGTAVANTALIYVFDISGSTLSGGGCGGDANGDGRTNNRIDCEVAAARALNQQAIASGIVAEVGLIGFASGGVAADLSPETGVQSLTGPGTDADDNDVPDVEQSMASVRTQSSGGSVGFHVFSSRTTSNTNTNFAAGITAACGLLSSSTQPNRLVVFLSDGENNGGPNVATVLPCAPPAVFHTFAAGPGVTCASNPSRGGLQTIANATGGTCTNVTDLNQLPDILEEVVGSSLTRLELTIDGGTPVDISSAADPDLPVDGPASVAVSYALPSLGDGLHEVCLTAFGSDAGGDGSVTTCSQVGGGGQLIYHWELIDIDGPPIFLSSASDPRPTFAAPDDATYTFEVTVTNGFGLTDTDRVVVTVANVDPELAIASSESTARSVTLVNATFTDEGWLDTHTATIDWGDGSAPVAVPVNTQGAGWGGFFGSHIYAEAGTYTVTATVTDDDGGTSSAATMQLSVAEPVAIWANSSSAKKTFEWAGGGGSITGLVHSNREVKVSGTEPKTIEGPTEYVTTISITGPHTVTPVQSSVKPIPLIYNVADYAPGGPVSVAVGSAYYDHAAQCVGGIWDVGSSLLPVGVHYVPCAVKLNGSSITGRFTLVATGAIELSGSYPAFEPYDDGLLLLSGASGKKAINVSASASKFLGVIYARFGEVSLSGSNGRFYCGIYGDTVSAIGSNLTLRGSTCGRPDSTVSGPLLVPELALDLTGQPADVLPGATIDYELTVTNDGGLLVVPGLLGLENVDTATATTKAYGYTLEYFNIATGTWLPLASAAGAVPGYTPVEPLPTTGGLTLVARPNAFAGVSYPATGDPLLGTVIDAGGFATWGYQALVDLTSAQVDLLMDETLVGGLRNRVTLELTPASVQVRRLYRNGTDFIADVRALTGDITDVEITATHPTGDPVFLDAATNPGLALLGPGDSITIPDDYTVAVIDPPGDGESDAAYLARLLAADGAQLFAAAFARATGGVGLLLAPQVHVGSTEHAPVVEVTKVGPLSALSGATLDYDITLRNRGSVQATEVALTDELDGEPLATGAVPTTLIPGQIVTSSASYEVDDDHPGGTLTNRAAATWTDAAGNDYGPLGDNVATEVLTPADLTATLADSLAVDADGNGVISPGDTIAYEAVLRNDGDAPLTDIVFDVAVDVRATLDPTSVTSSHGTITDGSDPGDTRVTVEIPSLGGHTLASIHFDLVIADPFDFPTAVVQMQGTVTSADLAPVLTDDPTRPGPADITVTHVVIPTPLLVALLSDAVAVDRDGNGVPSPDDTLRYTATVENQGSAPATDLILTIAADPNSAIVAGTATTSAGTITAGQNTGDTFVAVELASLAPVTTLTVTFEVRIPEPFPSGVDRLTVQGIINAAEFADPILTDDPQTGGEADPTTTLLTFAGGPPGGGLPGPAIGAVAPTEGTSITEPTTITAALTPPAGETVSGWTVSYRLEGDSARTEIASGTGPAVSATLDPTVMPNGAYVVEIEATASGGGVSIASTRVIVEGDLKLGRFQVTYEDLNVPIGGIPIQVLRTYDSFDKSRGDFGIGWQLEVANFRIATNGPLGAGGWTMFGCGGGLIFVPLCFDSDKAHYVTVTWPDGRVETFDLTPAQGSSFLPGVTSARFTGRAGATSTLAALDSGLYWSGDGNLYGGFFGSGGLYNPNRFRLTDRFGMEYVLEVGARGLVSARDRNGNTITVTDGGITSSLGPSIAFDRDGLGRIESVTDPAGDTIDYTYDAAGDLVSVEDQNDDVIEYGYEAGHFLTSMGGSGEPPLRTLQFEDGRLVSMTDGEGNVTELDIDVNARTQTVTGPDPRLTTILSFDEQGNATQIDQLFSGEHLTTSYTYNDLGLPLVSTDSLGHDSVAEYDAKGNLTKLTDRDGVVTTVTYTSLSQPDLVRVQGVLKQNFDYNDFGDVTKVTYGDSSFVEFEYDGAGQLVLTRDMAGNERTITYEDGLPSTVTELRGTTTYDYDDQGRLTSIEDPLGGVVGYGYDDVGNVTSITDQNDHARTFEYDQFGRLEKAIDQFDVESTYTYDDAGRLKTQTDRNGRTRTYEYDPNSQVTSITGTDGTAIGFEYDAIGRLINATSPLGDVRRSWDDASRVTEEVFAPAGLPEVAIQRTWTDAGQLASIVDTLGTTTFDYDPQGRLETILDSAAGAFEFGYDGADRILSFGRPNGIVETYTYVGGRLDTTTINGPSGLLESIDLDYDEFGFPSRLTDRLGEHLYDHDALGRLTAADHPAGSGVADEAYTYDAAGNRTSWVGNPASAVVLDDANRLRADATFDYTYDSEGRLITRRARSTGATTTFTWNALDQLTSVTTADGTVVQYGYDGLGRKVQTNVDGTVARTAFVGPNPRLLLNPGHTPVQRVVEGLGLDSWLATQNGGAVSYPISGPGGSVRTITNAAGAVTQTFDYDSFGKTGAATSPLHGWHGLSSDESGVLHAEARAYDPHTGRFLSEDALPAENLYAYSGNSPLLASDPTGLVASAEYGMNSSGSTARGVQICGQGSWTASFILDTAMDIGMQAGLAVLAGQMGIYSFVTPSGERYVGKSTDIMRRLSEHMNDLLKLKGAGKVQIDIKLLTALGDAADDALPVAEQLVIDGCGGAKSSGGTLANKINAINKDRWAVLKQFDTDIDLIKSLLWP